MIKIRRKILFTATLLAIVTATRAQNSMLSFGVKMGGNLSNMIASHVPGSILKTYIGFQVGAFAEYAILPDVFLQSGLKYSVKGYKLEGAVTGEMAAGYLEIPIDLIYKIEIIPGIKVSLNGGPYLAYGVGGKTTYTISGVTTTSETFSDGQLKKRDLGFGAGGGFEFKKFLVNFNYEVGVLHIADSPTRKMRNSNASFTLGYRF